MPSRVLQKQSESAEHHIPQLQMQQEETERIRAIFTAGQPGSIALAERFLDDYRNDAPDLVKWEWDEFALSEGLVLIQTQTSHWRQLPTVNAWGG